MNIFLIRHAQAGDIKTNYDKLSERGKLQARKLGQYFYKNNIHFDIYVCGSLNRHKETISIIRQELKAESELIICECLNEISEIDFNTLLNYFVKKDKFLYNLSMKLQLFNDSEKVKEVYIIILKNILKNWIQDSNCPIKFQDYKKNVLKIFDFINTIYNHNLKNMLIVSSGTPISLILGSVFQLRDEESLNWLKKIYNTSISIFRQYKKNTLEPISINFCPHLLISEQTLI